MGRLLKKLLSYPLWAIPLYLLLIIFIQMQLAQFAMVVLSIVVCLTCYGSYRHKKQEKSKKKVREK